MSRASKGFTEMVVDARRDLEELKTLQIFGSDSMNINSWSQDVTMGTTAVSYTLTLTPDNADLGVLPLAVNIQLSSTSWGYEPYQVIRTDGTFQWTFTLGGYQSSESVRIMLRWIGAGTVTLT